MDKSIEYYNSNGNVFIDNTLEADMSPARQRFLAHLPAGARILDLGCGAGRDSKASLDQGYQVEAVDGSAAMCEATSNLTGKPALKILFAELDYDQEFDAVWASASLLHVPSSEIELVLLKVRQTIKPGGYLYVSVKQGSFEGWRNGRYFVDYDEEKLCALMNKAGMSVVEKWISQDVRPGRSDMWINLVAKKE